MLQQNNEIISVISKYKIDDKIVKTNVKRLTELWENKNTLLHVYSEFTNGVSNVFALTYHKLKQNKTQVTHLSKKLK